MKNNIQSTVITTFWHCNLSFVANPIVKRYLQRVSDGLRAISIVLMLLMMYELHTPPPYTALYHIGRSRCKSLETTCPIVSPPKNRPAYIVRTMLRWWIIGVEFNSHTMDGSIRFDFYGWYRPEHGLNNNVLLCAINNNKHQPLLGVTGARCCCPQWVRVHVNKRDNCGREPRGNCNINKVREIELILLYKYEHIYI
jgi:hypothetical protein